MSLLRLLVSADAVVPDHDAALRRCCEEWGLPEADPRFAQAPAGYGAKWTFARVHADRRLAPTALEVLGVPYRAPAPADRPTGYPYLPEIAAAQGDRPARNHSTVVAADVEQVAGRLRATGAAHRLDPPNDVLPFPRLWVGFDPERPERYDPAGDAGIRLEVIPFDVLRMPTGVPDAVPWAGDGRPVRILTRTLLVDELDEGLRRLERNFGLAPGGPVVTTADGVRRATLGFPHARSADLELIDARRGTGPEADFHTKWGPGPFSIRVEVDGLAALEARLAARRVPHDRLGPARPGGAKRLFRPAERIIGTAFEFVEALAAGAGVP